MQGQGTEHAKLNADFLPRNEMGVLFLFAAHAEFLGFRVRRVQERFPDCIAERLNGEKGEVKIEFEYRASNFRQHGHDPAKCDYIVCWQNDWPDAPDNVKIVELRNRFNAPKAVWIQGAVRSEQSKLSDHEIAWAVRKDCSQDDLLLMYRCMPVKSITDIFVAKGELNRQHASWRPGTAVFRNIEKLCSLTAEISLNELRSNAVLRNAGFVRANMQGIGHLVTGDDWKELHGLLISRNPHIKNDLVAYAP